MNFLKMDGAGNDFIMTSEPNRFSGKQIAAMCSRRRGIGADGIIFLASLGNGEFQFDYFNSDGSGANLCGNGLRCAMEFVVLTGMTAAPSARFHTASGVLSAERIAPEVVRIQMPVPEPFRTFELDGLVCARTVTGVPHLIVEKEGFSGLDVSGEGSRLRYAAEFAPEGVNVDFIFLRTPDELELRTYERGCECETAACGTGVVSAAVYAYLFHGGAQKKRAYCSEGDVLEVEITEKNGKLQNVFLTGPARCAFSGCVKI